MCVSCLTNKAEKPIEIFGESDYERVINGIIYGNITTSSLDFETYNKIAEALTAALYTGFGSTLDELQYSSEAYSLLNDMRRNVYYFSGAKTYQQTREISEQFKQLFSGKGEIKTLSDFKKGALEILKTYNVNYLTTEYNFAISQGLSANRWQQIESEKHLYGCLKYVTVGDGRVRPEHAALDGIVRPVGDSFWKKFYPPNGWNCRCTVMQVDCGDTPPTDISKLEVENVPEIFRMNAGLDRIVYSKKHPYFKVADKDKDLARVNWNLPTP
jgi:SPP1 gp7 family putative phage head morphogenesis protein